MKKIIIDARITGNQLGKIIQKEGFDDSLSATLELIGLLESIKQKEIDKLKTFVTEEL